jgi:hypothetical protein
MNIKQLLIVTLIASGSMIATETDQNTASLTDQVTRTYLIGQFGEQKQPEPAPIKELSFIERCKEAINKRIIDSKPNAQLPTDYDIQKIGFP